MSPVRAANTKYRITSPEIPPKDTTDVNTDYSCKKDHSCNTDYPYKKEHSGNKKHSCNKDQETITISKHTANLLLGISTINAVLALIILFLK